MGIDDEILETKRRLQDLEMKRDRENVLALHTTPITQQKSGRWYTKIKLPDGHWKTISKTKYSDLEDVLYEYYKDRVDRRTVKNVFEEWIAWKKTRREIRPATETRYTNWFKQFFGEYESKDIRDFADYDFLEELIFDRVKTYSLTAKTYGGLRLVLSGILNYANRKRYVSFSPRQFFDDLDLSDRSLAIQEKKRDEDQVFTEDEVRQLGEYFRDHPTPRNLGLLLMFQSGLRIGELSALRRENVDLQTPALVVTATEISYDKDGQRITEVQDIPKTKTGRRVVVLPDASVDLIKHIQKVSPFGEWLFARETGARFTSKDFRYMLRVACNKIGIPVRSTHAIRKTYASALLDSGTASKIVQRQLGHADISTTEKYYHRDRSELMEKKSQINAAISM